MFGFLKSIVKPAEPKEEVIDIDGLLRLGSNPDAVDADVLDRVDLLGEDGLNTDNGSDIQLGNDFANIEASDNIELGPDNAVDIDQALDLDLWEGGVEVDSIPEADIGGRDGLDVDGLVDGRLDNNGLDLVVGENVQLGEDGKTLDLEEVANVQADESGVEADVLQTADLGGLDLIKALQIDMDEGASDPEEDDSEDHLLEIDLF